MRFILYIYRKVIWSLLLTFGFLGVIMVKKVCRFDIQKVLNEDGEYMKLRAPRDTGSPLAVLIAILSIVLLIFLYSVLGTVEIVFEVTYENEDRVISRQENVRAISDIEIPDAADQYYVVGAEDVIIDDADDIKAEIMKTLVVNLFTFKWQEDDHIIRLHSK